MLAGQRRLEEEFVLLKRDDSQAKTFDPNTRRTNTQTFLVRLSSLCGYRKEREVQEALAGLSVQVKQRMVGQASQLGSGMANRRQWRWRGRR